MDGDDAFREIEELFDQVTQLTGAVGDPPVDIVEDEAELVVVADLPGRTTDEIDVRLEDDQVLHIDAPEREDELSGRYVTRERSREGVSRSVRLPAAVDEAETTASYDGGVLTVRLGKLTGDGEGADIPVN
ncbi:MAG: Hsp20/alpha crystallin family protein [Halovenus sp.]